MSRVPSENRIRTILHDLLESSPYLKAAAVVRVSGLVVVAVMPTYIEQDLVSAMSAVMLLLGERITRAMRSGRLDKVYIKGEEGHIVLMSIGRSAVLTVLAREQAQLGLLFVEMQQSVSRLKRLI